MNLDAKVQIQNTTQPEFDSKHLFIQESANDYSDAIKMATDCVLDFLKNTQKPFSGISPNELKKEFEKINLTIPFSNYKEVFAEAQKIYTQHAIAFHLPKYVAHLNCPVVIPALAAEVLISAINSSLDTWDQSAGGTLIEQKLIKWTANEIGFDQKADGVFTSGGSQSNLMGLLLARDHYAIQNLNHNIKRDGLPKEASLFRIFVSEESHFSIQKSASLLGLGEQAIVKVKTDRSFRMNVVLLEDAIKREISNGAIPIAIVATAGTTDFGTIDPLLSIGTLASKHKLWFHVDAAYGGGLLLTDKYRHLINGIHTAHSVTVDYHKTFFQPVSSSAFIVNDKRYFGLITHYADYLNPKDHDDDGIPNQVNKSIQTTRRFDALKLWFSLRLIGKQEFGTYIDKIIETTKEVVKVIENDALFELLNHSDLSALVFRYSACPFKSFDLNNVNQHIKAQLYKNGHGLVAGTKVNDEFYLKFTILNPMTQCTDIQDILTLIKKYGNDYINFN